jgi:hypothetical protein
MMKSIALTTATLVVMLVGPGLKPARADLKDEFQKGCESGHGSFVENVGNVQCNTSGGLTITCDKKITSCTLSAQVIPIKPTTNIGGAFQGYFTGKVKIAPPSGWQIAETRVVK